MLAAAQGLGRSAREGANKASRAWAACLKRIFEVDPVRCEGCGGEMKLVTVIEDDSEIKRILEHLGLPADFPKSKPPRAPPLPLSFKAGEGSQLEPRGDNERQDWPGRPGSDWSA